MRSPVWKLMHHAIELAARWRRTVLSEDTGGGREFAWRHRPEVFR
jgi:hypothetical protein